MKKLRSIHWVLLAGALAALGVLAWGAWLYRSQEVESRAGVGDELLLVAHTKVEQISAWRAERLADAHVLMNRPLLLAEIARWEPAQDPVAGDLLVELQTIRSYEGYRDVLLLDTGAHVRLSSTGRPDSLDPEVAGLVALSLRDGLPRLTDLHTTPGDGDPHMGVVAPLFVGDGQDPQPVGAIVLQADASSYLFPLIQSWPTASASAETLLVRREGDEVLYLNELRHQSGTALKLRFPLSSPELPAAQAILGRQGIYQGRDYRGVEVLAALLPVPDSPWFLVAKVDVSEAFAPWRSKSRQIVALIVGVLVATIALEGITWQADQRTLMARQLALAQEKAQMLVRLEEERNLLEQRVEERTAQLEDANRELEAFSYSVAHDLRAPLRAVDGYVRILEEDYEPLLDAEAKRLLGVVRDQAHRMAQLIDALLRFSRLGRQEMHKVRTDMTALAAEAFAHLQAGAPVHDVEFRLGDLPPAQVDPVLLHEVWLNLLGNALKFTRPGQRSVIEVGGSVHDAETIYFVKDNGAGFDMNYGDKLFGVFQRLHTQEQFEGTGIGLALVQRIILRHRGRIWAEAKPDAGATFYFSLPDEKGDMP